jgi:hypothetical protein
MRASILSGENYGVGVAEDAVLVASQVSKILMPTCSGCNVPNGAVAGAAFR